MGFANPLLGRIQAKEEPWLGTPIFRVVATFGQIDDDHLTPHQGVDFGNGRCGDPVMACEAGTVETIQDPNGALIVRVRHSPTLVTGYAHLAAFSVAPDQIVARGQQIGTVGSTGADACHLHWGVNLSGQEIDGWPMLDQNHGGDVELKGTPVNPVQNRKTILTAGGAFVADPTPASFDVIRSFQPGQLFVPDWLVTGREQLGTDEWYGGWEPNSQGGPLRHGYLSAALCGPLVPIEAGDTDAAYNQGLSDAQAAVEALPER